MFKVIVVDDEPSACTQLCSIIKKRCLEFEIMGIAENGEEALSLVKRVQPDVVVTDIKMPLMDGIQLVSMLKINYPDILSIIISGYGEFEYAQSAMKSGVCDYILKPVVPSALVEAMDNAALKLRFSYYQNRNNIIRKLYGGDTFQDDWIVKYYPYENYYAAIIRKNGLPRRFSVINGVEVCSDVNEIMTIYGRDEMEALYLIPNELLLGKPFEQYIRRVYNKEVIENQYITSVFIKNSFSVKQLQNYVKKLYRSLDTACIVGVNQIINLDEALRTKEAKSDDTSINQTLLELGHLLQENKYDKFKKVLRQLFYKWEKEKRTQLWLERALRRILELAGKYHGEQIDLTENEYMMEDAFFYATSMEELYENLLEVIFKPFKESRGDGKVDSPEFFLKVIEYMDQNMAENITLYSVCKRFGISQTYLSKMFRKYEQESFNKCLTAARMKKAMELMESDSKMLIKDIAALVGYNDQFYFSRIFRAYTGQCPSDYNVEKAKGYCS